MAWGRYAIILIVLSAFLVARGGLGRLKTTRPKTQIVRGLMLGASTLLYFTSLTVLPLAEAAAIGFVTLTSAPAWAAGSNMPWEQPLNQILQSVEGPVAKILAVIIIIVTGLTLAFGETSGGFRRLIQIVFGLSIAFAASSFFLSFFSFGGGALI